MPKYHPLQAARWHPLFETAWDRLHSRLQPIEREATICVFLSANVKHQLWARMRILVNPKNIVKAHRAVKVLLLCFRMATDSATGWEKSAEVMTTKF